MTNKKNEAASSAEFSLKIKPYKTKKGEEYMSAGQKAHFKAILEQWKGGLVENIDATVSHLKDEPNHIADMNDRATLEEEFSLELKTRDRERKLIAKIDEAIHALELDDYGYCDECGVEIGIRRLEARPTATLCIDCKTLAEVKERHSGA